jgi:hypothetical protein
LKLLKDKKSWAHSSKPINHELRKILQKKLIRRRHSRPNVNRPSDILPTHPQKKHPQLSQTEKVSMLKKQFVVSQVNEFIQKYILFKK